MLKKPPGAIMVPLPVYIGDELVEGQVGVILVPAPPTVHLRSSKLYPDDIRALMESGETRLRVRRDRRAEIETDDLTVLSERDVTGFSVGQLNVKLISRRRCTLTVITNDAAEVARIDSHLTPRKGWVVWRAGESRLYHRTRREQRQALLAFTSATLVAVVVTSLGTIIGSMWP